MSQKYDTDVAHYNFNARQPILVIFINISAENYQNRLVCVEVVHF